VAFETGVKVVPVYIDGIADKPAKGSLVMHPGKIEICCLEPVDPADCRSHVALKNKVRTKLEEFIKRRFL
jgi:hypothetical protein